MPVLDRLGALVAGLAPSIGLSHSGALTEGRDCRSSEVAGLGLHLLVAGEATLTEPADTHTLVAPAVAVLPAGCPARLEPRAVATRVMSIDIRFDGPAREHVLAAFARPVVLALDAIGDDLRHVLALIRGELEQPRCGREVLLARAGEILLIGVLRHVIARPGLGAGILNALSDPRLAQSVVAMHESPAEPWSLEALSARAGMSRTAFAVAFRDKMGCTPGSYLAGLRLAIAEQHIARGSGLKRAARAAGYGSPAALSRALSRRREGLRSQPSASPAPR